MRRQTTPEVNAGSMADIAFLLLIFFLITTTIDKDKGIARQLPPALDTAPKIEIKQKNILEIVVNPNNEIMIETDRTALTEVRTKVIAFLDNGGIPQGQDGYCDFCLGKRDILSSDNPQKAVVSISPDRLTNYDTYLKVQNEVSSAFAFLRNRESQRLFGMQFTEVDQAVKEGRYKGNLEKAKEQLAVIKQVFPMLISEAETKREIRL